MINHISLKVPSLGCIFSFFEIDVLFFAIFRKKGTLCDASLLGFVHVFKKFLTVSSAKAEIDLKNKIGMKLS